MIESNSNIRQYCFIVGAMKSGTSALFNMLRQHPEICPSVPKEPNFFANDKVFAKGLDYYRSLWQWDSEIHKVALEASTGYTKKPFAGHVPERIAASGLSVKFIYMIRHPIARIESQLRMAQHYGWSTFLKNGKIHPNVISYSKYYYQISEYYHLFPKDTILLLRFEDFIDHPDIVLHNICKFLDIDMNFRFSTKVPTHDGAAYALAANPKLQRFNTGKITRLIRFIPEQLRNKTERLLLSWAKRKTKLNADQKKEVLEEIREDLYQLQNELGFDISFWKLDLQK